MTEPVLEYQPRHAKRFIHWWIIALGLVAVIFCVSVLWFYIMPRYTAAKMARINSLRSTLMTLRGQIELFKIQHNDHPPATSALVEVLTGRTGFTDTFHSAATGTLGPYMFTAPRNVFNSNTAV